MVGFRFFWFFLFSFILVGCGTKYPKNPAPIAQSPPPALKEPVLDSSVALRPTFEYGGGLQETGTAFVLQDKSGEQYLVTAAHLYGKDEWPTMRRITLKNMAGKEIGHVSGAPKYVGKFTEDSNDMQKPFADFSEDLVITPIPKELRAAALKLSDKNPEVRETVWVIGCARKEPSEQRLYAARVLEVTQTAMAFDPIKAFDPWDFSGGPVVNSKGEVVGNLLVSTNRNQMVGTTALGIRKRLGKMRVQID